MIADRRTTSTLARWITHLTHLAGSDAEVMRPWPPPSAVRPARSGPGGPGGEVELWTALEAHGGAALDRFPCGIDLSANGPLWPSSNWAAIEVWTEAELCGVHGLWRAARLASSTERGESIRRRLASLVTWHLEHTQPDNATNRPWALHVFLLDGGEEARLYGETLVHNAQAQGNEDPASRWILADAARELAEALRLREG